MMYRQKGVALLVVLALLAGAVVIGISAMQSSLVDETLAGNYRMASQAQMNAEKAASAAIADTAFFNPATWQGEPHRAWFEGLPEGSQPEWEATLRQQSYSDLLGLATAVEADTSAPRYSACDAGSAGANDLNHCFYFPMTIPDEQGAKLPGHYVVAVGSVNDDAGDPQATSIVLVEIKPGSSRHEGIDEELAQLFEDYLMASGSNTFVEGMTRGENAGTGPELELDGPLHMEDGTQDFKRPDSVATGDNVDETRGDTTLGKPLPAFDLASFTQSIQKTPDGSTDREHAVPNPYTDCNNLPTDLGGKVYHCSGQQELTDLNVSNGSIIFDAQTDFSGTTTLKDVNIAATSADNITFQGSIDFNNAKIGADKEIEYNWDENGPVDYAGTTANVVNSHFLTNKNVQMNFGDNAVLNGVYFYANDESEVQFGINPSMDACGSIIGTNQAELYVGKIDRFSQCAPDGDGMGVGSWR